MSLHHSPRIVTNSLVFHVDAADRKCYSGGSTCKDLANINGNGTLVDVSFSSDKAFLMNSATSNISFTRSFTNITNSVTYSVFCQLSLPGIGSYNTIMSSSNNVDGGILILNVGSGSVYAIESDILNDAGSSVDAIITDSIYIKDQKFLITVTVNATVFSMYVNNILVGSNSPHFGGDVNSQANIYLGYNPLSSLTEGASGVKIYKALIYNRPLSGAEILQNYNAMKGRLNL